ncbi:MAG: zinc ribbon domain-containing protein [Anaerolineales bacterium]|nr:zinc ribbon domain-containing protein [Anaerolineales bacterium]
MMKRFLSTSLVALLALSAWASAHAQTPPTVNPPLEFISVQLWPDYDQEALLVLISGVLPADVSRPATVSLPLPPNSTVNAVAQVSEDGGGLLNLEYEVEGNLLTFTTPSPGFRVEYYQPYVVTGTERMVRFAWTPTTAVGQVVTSVQEPLAAQNFTLSPPADQIQQLDNGIRYHLYNPQSLTAGQPLFVEINYDLPTGQLTQSLMPSLPASETALPEPAPETTPRGVIPDWVLFAGAFGFLLVGLFFFASAWLDRQKKKGTPNKPVRGKFCGVCGTAVGKNDKFCRQCGSPTP